MMNDLTPYFMMGVRGATVVAGFLFAAVGVFLTIMLAVSIVGGICRLLGRPGKKD